MSGCAGAGLGVHSRPVTRSKETPSRIPALVLVAFSLTSTPVFAAFDIRLGYFEWQGEFESLQENQIVNMPLEVTVNGEMARLFITIPYTKIDRTGNLLFTPEGPAVIGTGGPGKPPFQTSPAGSSASGLGDILLREEMFLVKAGKGKRPAVSFVLDYKFATADQEDGLGTGESDWGGGLKYVQPAGKVFQILGDATYRFTGDPTGTNFNDRLRLGFGVAMVFKSSLWRLYGQTVDPILDEVAVFDSAGLGIPIGTVEAEDYRNVRLDVAYVTGRGGTVRMGVSQGLNDFSEDFGWYVVISSGPP